MLAHGEVIEWPDGPVASLEVLAPALAATDGWGLVVHDGEPLVALVGDRFVQIPIDARTPVRAYANARGHPSTACYESYVAVANGAFLTCDRDRSLVAREVATLAVRRDRPAIEGASAVYGDGDTFVVAARETLVGLDAGSGTERWRRTGTGTFGVRTGRGSRS